MIYLKDFEQRRNYYAFNTSTGEVKMVDKPDSRFFGFLTFLQPNLVAALYRKADVLTLQIGLNMWPNNLGSRTSHQHRDGETTVFTLLQDETPVYEHTYPSWWQRPNSFFNVAEGSPPDEEEDYLAYVHYNF